MSNPDELIEGTPNASPELAPRKGDRRFDAARGSHLSIKKGQEIGEVSEGALEVINRKA